jgi:hypothetical protein
MSDCNSPAMPNSITRTNSPSGPIGGRRSLRGAFSIALCDRVERKLMAAADGLGVNRLVYAGVA